MKRVWGAALLAALAMPTPAQAQEISRFTENNVIHIVAHEMGHAVIREFDLPILTFEEAMADDFATLLVMAEFPDRAPEILRDRMRSQLADGDEPTIFSEYLHDAQRAGRMACLAYGTEPERYIVLAEEFGMNIAEEGDACIDSAPEIARAWRRILAPLHLPDGAPVTEVGVQFDAQNPLVQRFRATGLGNDLGRMLARIDWHSRITLIIAECDGGAMWRRNGRQIVVCSAYIQRFEDLSQALDN